MPWRAEDSSRSGTQERSRDKNCCVSGESGRDEEELAASGRAEQSGAVVGEEEFADEAGSFLGMRGVELQEVR